MTEKTFKASNGYEVAEEGGGFLIYDKQGTLYTSIPESHWGALREFFRHERDTELGRARWPENPDYVIYRAPEYDDEDGRCVRVLHEPSAITTVAWERWPAKPIDASDVVARWYFTEGPGKPERTWEEAKAGEVWWLTVDGEEGTFLVDEYPTGAPYFVGLPASLYVGNERITAGRKLLEADGSVADDQD